MKIQDCPKNLNRCPEKMCPEFPCWAYDRYMKNQEKSKIKQDEGWE